MIASINQPVKWMSPVGLPVVQPYKKYKNYMVSYLSSFSLFALTRFLQQMMRNASLNLDNLNEDNFTYVEKQI